MQALEFLKYVSGTDLFQYQDRRERVLLRHVEERKGGISLPIECGIEVAVRIYAGRLKTVAQYPLVLVSRITGLDYLYSKLTKK